MKPVPQYDNPVHELIGKRWSPRAFSDKDIDEKTVLSLFEAARWAPSCMNGQPWRFLAAARADAERFGKMSRCLNERNREWAPSAALLVITMVQKHPSPDNQVDAYALYDLGLAVGNLTTQATALGLYMHTLAGFSAETAKTLFAIPEGIEPVTMLAIGYLGDPGQLSEFNRGRELAPRTRLPINELVLQL